jgi:hypothetical protein
MLSMPIGETCHEFQETEEDGKTLTEEARQLKYAANKLQKDRRAKFSFRKGKNGKPSMMWRVALDAKPQPVEETQAQA